VNLLRCGPLWSLISASFFLVMGYSAIGGLGQYVNIYYVCNGDMLEAGTIAGIKGSVLAVSGIAMLPFFAWLGEKYDKRTVVMLMLSMSMFGHLLNYWLMTPEHPYWQIVSGFFESSAIGAVWMFLPSMKADVADYDEHHTPPPRGCDQRLLLLVHQSVAHRLDGHRRRSARVVGLSCQSRHSTPRSAPPHVCALFDNSRRHLDVRALFRVVLPADSRKM
jgi:hypothetical protein